jgi:hypothetical protein
VKKGHILIKIHSNALQQSPEGGYHEGKELLPNPVETKVRHYESMYRKFMLSNET